MSRHLDVETLSAMLDGELAGDARAAAVHLEGCEECRARLAGLRDTVAQLRSLPKAPPPSHVREALRRQVAAEEATRRQLWTLPGWHSRLAAWPAMAAAVFLAFGCGIFLYAYLVHHPSLSPAETAPSGGEREWSATITYERSEGQDGAPPAARAAEDASSGPDRAPKSVARRPVLRQAEPEAPAAPPVAEPVLRQDLSAAEEAAPAPQAAGATEGVELRRRDEPIATNSAARGAASAPAPPAPAASSEIATDQLLAKAEEREDDEEVFPLGPGIEKPVRIAGKDVDLAPLRDLRLRQSLVIVECVIGREGSVRDVRIRPEGLHPRLLAALRETIATWRFRPALKDGHPVAVRYVLTVNIHPR